MDLIAIIVQGQRRFILHSPGVPQPSLHGSHEVKLTGVCV